MNVRRSYSFYLGAVSLSIALVFAHSLLPKKRHRLLPNSDSMIYITDDNSSGGKSKARFLDASLTRMHCSMAGGAKNPFCGIGVATSTSSVDWTAGTDFSGYDTMEIKFRYRGPTSKIRISLRNFDRNVSSADDYNSAKYNSVYVRRIDFDSEIRIPLSEFRISDWWIDQFNISHHLAVPTFDRVTSMGIEFTSPPDSGEHYIEIEKLDFTGDYISAENWYLGILGSWLIGILVNISLRLQVLNRRAKHDAQRVKEMEEYAETLKHEKNIYKNLSNSDPLTGVLNRFGMMEIVDISCKWQHSDDNISIILIDIDDFKTISDNIGQQDTDALLCKLGVLLRENTRSFDSIARWGGEEFLLFFPHTKPEAALHIAEKIRNKIPQLNPSKNEDLKLTASIGISQVYPGEKFTATFARADAALCDAKSEGGNRCIVNSSPASH